MNEHIKTKTMEWNGDELILIDQRYLPLEETYVTCKNHIEVADSIRDMVVRGAPAIGATAGFGMAIASSEFESLDKKTYVEKMKKAEELLASTRPTAVNLFWALKRMSKIIDENIEKTNLNELTRLLKKEALEIAYDDIKINRKMGQNGAKLLKNGDTVLTHCNAGALATVDYGTALGVIRAAIEDGKKISVYADETRPYLQGARLTVWELVQDGIETTLISDNMAGWVMKQGKINAVIVGADRIAANGDVANKIGTYSVAILAKKHGIPFYVAAPLSTIDLETPTGEEIPIEERNRNEVRYCHKSQLVDDSINVYNPAFDVTPNDLVTAIITEKGVVKDNYKTELPKLFE
ncbi:S-methyl-5-thioribose-1-phosphate isomerase [Geotoga petraea]|jgi:methylthioribose-1-phosphate isomerase|uniref:Methylthioribose-1-phosphate isomerase n=1 Tax=Geotoga petraea TaxID=28234 RepID=A0A1G6HZW9_9BACT|nr:S-methyl-5-thioribose-1-phosphate isomerase [Geotoga petraea]SDB99698.1 methylthioribose-1-phosphate isomerase [Geotoga petraea]